jgi:hypothetical protein
MISDDDKKFPLIPGARQDTKRDLLGLFKQGPLETTQQFAERVAWESNIALAKLREAEKLRKAQGPKPGLPCNPVRTTTKAKNMRRTLLAVGFAVLLSMMATPHRSWRHNWNCWLVYENCQYEPFFRTDASEWDWERLEMQTVFLSVLFAVLVNLRKSWRATHKQSS